MPLVASGLAGKLWSSLAFRGIAPICLLHVYPSKKIQTEAIQDLRLILPQCDLILTEYLCKDPLSK